MGIYICMCVNVLQFVFWCVCWSACFGVSLHVCIAICVCEGVDYMYVGLYVHVLGCMCTCMYVLGCLCMYERLCTVTVCIFTRVYVGMCTYVCVFCVYSVVCACICVGVYVWVYLYMCEYGVYV